MAETKETLLQNKVGEENRLSKCWFLTSKCVMWHVYSCTRAHEHTHTCNLKSSTQISKFMSLEDVTVFCTLMRMIQGTRDTMLETQC